MNDKTRTLMAQGFWTAASGDVHYVAAFSRQDGTIDVMKASTYHKMTITNHPDAHSAVRDIGAASAPRDFYRPGCPLTQAAITWVTTCASTAGLSRARRAFLFRVGAWS